jgi:hypothetical protein
MKPAERAYRANLGDILAKMHLEIADKYSMACSVEVRLPYLDAGLVAAGLALTAGSRMGAAASLRKVILMEMLAEQLDPVRLGILRTPKYGFPASGIGHLRGFAQYCESHLPDAYLDGHDLASVYPSKHELVLYDLFAFLMGDCRGKVPPGFRLKAFIDALPGLP